MKRNLLHYFVILLLIFNTALSGCAEKNKLTLEEIKKQYNSENPIKFIQNIGNSYILIESQSPGVSNKFYIYNLKTGDKDELPTLSKYVKLEKIINENYFIFLSSGVNSESSIGNFPELIKCIRIKNDINKMDDFISIEEDKYFSLDYSIQSNSSGSKDGSLLSNINITYDGFEVLFRPIAENDIGFYADITDIPTTRTSYNKDLNQITFEINTSHLGKNIEKILKTNNNHFIYGYEIQQKDNKTYLIIALTDIVKSYSVQMKRLPDELPYLFVKFSTKL